jgi:hypothetical protein
LVSVLILAVISEVSTVVVHGRGAAANTMIVLCINA